MDNGKLLQLRYKGSRDYLHGTDIYNETLSWLEGTLGEIKEIDFAFHHLAKHQIEVTTDIPAGEQEPVAICSFLCKGTRQRIFLIETGDAVTDRYPYPEDELVGPMVVDIEKRRGILHAALPYSEIEIWVAMTKALHYKAFPLLQGKWLFVRGRFARFVRHEPLGVRELGIAASFNNKLTRSEALFDGVKAGEIFFSIV